MARPGRSALLVTALAAFAASGCSIGAVPAPPSPKPNVVSDPAFTPDKLRAIDPCALLDPATLSALGTPSVNKQTGLGECGNDMKDPRGNDLSVDVLVGGTVSTGTTNTTLAGLPVYELNAGTVCSDEIHTQSNAAIGITVRTSTCSQARQLATAVINRIRHDPPQRSLSGSLAAIDPCTTVDDQTAAAAVGSAPDEIPSGLYHCEWESGGNIDLTVGFTVGDPKGTDPASTHQPVDLGGVNGYQTQQPNSSCEVSWATRPTGAGDFEIVDIEFESTAPQQVDRCAKAVAVARAVATKVPRPS